MEKHADSLDTLKQAVETATAALVYFSAPTCNVCHALKPKLLAATQERYPEMEWISVDVSQMPEAGAAFNVFTIPTAIIFLQGKEFVRKGRAFGPAELLDAVERPYAIMTGA